LKLATAKVGEASKMLFDAIALFPPLGAVLMPVISLLTKVMSQSARLSAPPQMPTVDGSPGPVLDQPPQGMVGTGNPQAVLRAMMSPRG
jgi:hypothetical protein